MNLNCYGPSVEYFCNQTNGDNEETKFISSSNGFLICSVRLNRCMSVSFRETIMVDCANATTGKKLSAHFKRNEDRLFFVSTIDLAEQKVSMRTRSVRTSRGSHEGGTRGLNLSCSFDSPYSSTRRKNGIVRDLPFECFILLCNSTCSCKRVTNRWSLWIYRYDLVVEHDPFKLKICSSMRYTLTT